MWNYPTHGQVSQRAQTFGGPFPFSNGVGVRSTGFRDASPLATRKPSNQTTPSVPLLALHGLFPKDASSLEDTPRLQSRNLLFSGRRNGSVVPTSESVDPRRSLPSSTHPDLRSGLKTRSEGFPNGSSGTNDICPSAEQPSKAGRDPTPLFRRSVTDRHCSELFDTYPSPRQQVNPSLSQTQPPAYRQTPHSVRGIALAGSLSPRPVRSSSSLTTPSLLSPNAESPLSGTDESSKSFGHQRVRPTPPKRFDRHPSPAPFSASSSHVFAHLTKSTVHRSPPPYKQDATSARRPTLPVDEIRAVDEMRVCSVPVRYSHDSNANLPRSRSGPGNIAAAQQTPCSPTYDTTTAIPVGSQDGPGRHTNTASTRQQGGRRAGSVSSPSSEFQHLSANMIPTLVLVNSCSTSKHDQIGDPPGERTSSTISPTGPTHPPSSELVSKASSNSSDVVVPAPLSVEVPCTTERTAHPTPHTEHQSGQTAVSISVQIPTSDPSGSMPASPAVDDVEVPIASPLLSEVQPVTARPVNTDVPPPHRDAGGKSNSVGRTTRSKTLTLQPMPSPAMTEHVLQTRSGRSSPTGGRVGLGQLSVQMRRRPASADWGFELTGRVITSVRPGTSADKSGLCVGDTVLFVAKDSSAPVSVEPFDLNRTVRTTCNDACTTVRLDVERIRKEADPLLNSDTKAATKSTARKGCDRMDGATTPRSLQTPSRCSRASHTAKNRSRSAFPTVYDAHNTTSPVSSSTDCHFDCSTFLPARYKWWVNPSPDVELAAPPRPPLSSANYLASLGLSLAGLPGHSPSCARGSIPGGSHIHCLICVEEVMPGSPADVAGLRSGDFIWTWGPYPLLYMRDLQTVATAMQVGQVVRLTVLRPHPTDGDNSYQAKEVVLTVGGQQRPSFRCPKTAAASPDATPTNGPGPLTGFRADMQPFPPLGCACVISEHCTLGSPAERAGLSRGDAIVQVGDRVVCCPQDVVEVFQRSQPSSSTSAPTYVEIRALRHVCNVCSSSGDRGWNLSECHSDLDDGFGCSGCWGSYSHPRGGSFFADMRRELWGPSRQHAGHHHTLLTTRILIPAADDQLWLSTEPTTAPPPDPFAGFPFPGDSLASYGWGRPTNGW